MATDCSPNALAALAAPYRGIAQKDRELIMIALLQKIAGTTYTPNQLLDLAKCYSCVPESDVRRIQAALLCVATGGTPPCPECPPSGGCTYQDMQVAWTPTNLTLSDKLVLAAYASGSLTGITALSLDWTSTTSGGFDIESGDDLTSISAPNATNMGTFSFFTLIGLPALTLVDFPVLTHHEGTITVQNCTALPSLSFPSLQPPLGTQSTFSVTGNTSLTSVSLNVWTPNLPSLTISFNGNALAAPSVNHILARCVANPAYTVGSLDLSGGTNAAPTGQGIADKATLIGRGVTVNTN